MTKGAGCAAERSSREHRKMAAGAISGKDEGEEAGDVRGICRGASAPAVKEIEKILAFVHGLW